jgi:glycosyltransferase involved in cell wall biosynthesis
MDDRDDLRICVIGLRGLPGVMGGVETHCEELLPRVAALDDRIRFTVIGRKAYMPAGRMRIGAIDTIPLPAPRRPSLEAIVSSFLGVCHAWRHDFPVLHIHSIGPGLMTPLARLLGMRVIVTYHSANYEHAKWGRMARLALRVGEQASVRFSNRLIAVSPSLARGLSERFPAHRTKIDYVPNGVPSLEGGTESRSEILARLELKAGGYILAVGRLVREKGFDYLIEAVRRSDTPLQLVIVGDADHASEYSRALLAQADDKVRFVGFQPRFVLRHLYSAAGLFVLPSFNEGLPISALEAVNCGTPILLSDIPANRDICLPPENYFPVGDVDALAAALARPAAELRIDGDIVRRRFDWATIARDTLIIYLTVAGAKTSRARPVADCGAERPEQKS